ncbi:MAG: 4Fe-4S ferredoxin [Candidatus Schekmanbacteria bacterium]|nr:4Fe-4S ferredoxin [Candidatus Schekmanbacteria bacterium]
MSVIVDKKKCNGCKQLDEPQCVKNCPGDLMAINPEDGKSYCREGSDCWDCMVCVKTCPCMAIQTRLPYQLANYKATLVPKIGKDVIKWTSTDIKGNVEEFEIKTKEA